MRDIKFRGKRVDNGDWIYGYYFMCFTGIPYILVLHDHILGMTEYYEVIPETVGQYIGLKDKNDKEIYENDICLFSYSGNKRIEDIHFNNGSFCLGWCVSLRYAFLNYNKEAGESLEIIGNVHQNPELAKYFNSVVSDNPELLEGGEPNATP